MKYSTKTNGDTGTGVKRTHRLKYHLSTIKPSIISTRSNSTTSLEYLSPLKMSTWRNGARKTPLTIYYVNYRTMCRTSGKKRKNLANERY
jgi:hypothetical protein